LGDIERLDVIVEEKTKAPEQHAQVDQEEIAVYGAR
jgi:hypothetical protein